MCWTVRGKQRCPTHIIHIFTLNWTFRFGCSCSCFTSLKLKKTKLMLVNWLPWGKPVKPIFLKLGGDSHTKVTGMLVVSLRGARVNCRSWSHLRWLGWSPCLPIQVSLRAKTAKQSVFFSKSVKKSVKHGVRVLRARSAQAIAGKSHIHGHKENRLNYSNPGGTLEK